MKTILILSAAAALVLFLAGCVATKAHRDDTSIIQAALDLSCAPDFRGPIHAEHSNQYFKITIDAGDVHKVDGKWTWAWLEYTRESHFPLFSGLTWSSTGKVRLGARPQP